jgi:hypothetical protein
MATHLGRNPFGKKHTHFANSQPQKELLRKESMDEIEKSPGRKTAEWLLVDLPAGSFMLALKTVLFVKGVFDKSPKL